MPQKEPADRVQREIEELLDRLDNFVPEERLVSKIKKRQREESGPGAFERASTNARKRFSRITLGHIMLAGLSLMLLAWFVPGLFGGYAGYVRIIGLILTVAAFIGAVIGRDSQRTISGARYYEKRWRGQPIEYSDPPAASRFRDWLRRRGRK